MSDKSWTWEQTIRWLREQPDQRALVEACFYDDPLSTAARRYHGSTEWAAVRALLPQRKGRVLDIGSGRGIAAYALAADGWQVVALEPDPSSLVGAGAIRNLAADTGSDIEVVERPGESLPFADASFDLVHCRAVLHHARDLGKLCAEIGRVLKPGGRVVATREHVISRADDLPLFLDQHPLHRYYGGEHAYRRAEYESAIRAGGMRLIAAFNPWASDINLFPEDREEHRHRLARRLGLPSASFLPFWLIALVGGWMRTPGRLYTFVAERASER